MTPAKILSRAEFIDELKNIKLLAIDVDGVLTDDNIYVGADGFELKKFNVSDGFFMVLAMQEIIDNVTANIEKAAMVLRNG